MKTEFLKNWDTQLKKGLLPFYVLEALNQKECYGYELIQQLKEEYSVEVTESTIYPLLIRLMKDELLIFKWVEQTSGIPRKYYYIAELGKSTLAEMQQNLETIFTNLKKP
ncbi:MAG: PadR family transcriptional regulator [Spirosomataceae bacterium]